MQKPRVQIPLNALRSFEAAARLLSFNRAAAELGVTPSAVSLQVRRLEEAVGRPLFVRSHRSVALSETGARLAPRLGVLFSDMENLLSSVAEPEVNSLRISAMPSFAAKWLAPRLAEFTSRHPRYQVRLAGEDMLACFDRGDIDIGIRYGAGDYPGLHCERIAAATAFPVCSPAFAAHHAAALARPDGLLNFPLLQDEIAAKASGLPTWSSWFEAAGVRRLPDHLGPQFESHHMALAAAEASQGLALGLKPLVDDDLAAGRLIRLFDIGVPSAFSFWLVCRADRAKERKIAAFRSWMADAIAAPPVARPF